jgi:signal transduction histidine kinase
MANDDRCVDVRAQAAQSDLDQTDPTLDRVLHASTLFCVPPLPLSRHDPFEAALATLEELRVIGEQVFQQNEQARQIHAALQEQYRKYQELFEFAPEAYLITDLRGVIQEANRAAEVFFHLDNRYLVGKPLSVFVPTEGRPAFYALLAERPGCWLVREAALGFCPRNAAPIEARARIATLCDGEGGAVALRWLLGEPQEQSEQAERLRWLAVEVEKRVFERTRQLEEALARERQMREAAEAADRFKTEFLATLSHELRTPLNPVLGFVQLLMRSEQNPRTREALRIIERNAQHIAGLVDDLSDLARIAAGKMHLRLVPLALGAVVHSAAEVVRPEADGRQVRLIFSLEADPGTVLGDAARLRQVVWNLLTNAVKFTPVGGSVEVMLRYHGDQLQLRVIDTGIGIAPERLQRLFERFWQHETEARGGLGLGLFIVRHIVTAHGGRVWAESEGEGRGATFIVELPCATDASPPR